MDRVTQATTTLDRQLREVVATDPLDALVAITTARDVIAACEREAVFSALEQHTLREVGEALGVSKQAVFQRFGKEWVESTRARMSRVDFKQTVKQRLGR
jgi:AcrR family transcriptional regulator